MSERNDLMDRLAKGDNKTAPVAALLGYELSQAEQTPRVAPGLLNPKPFVILNGEVVYVDAEFDKPTRMAGTVKLEDAASFVAYWTKFKQQSSLIYAGMSPARFVAVLNENCGVLASVVRDPGFRDFRAVYQPKFSKEWDTWTGHDGQTRAFDGNQPFGEFVENNAPDFMSPPGGSMLEIALNMRVASNVAYSNAVRLADGNVILQYSNIVEGTTTQGTEQQKIPEKFTISIPVFAGLNQPKYEMEARFRFRVVSAKLRVWYDLVRPHKVLEKAFEAMWEEIGDKAQTTILLGSPD